MLLMVPCRSEVSFCDASWRRRHRMGKSYMTLTIARRLGLMGGLVLLASLGIIAQQLLALRASLENERKSAVMAQVTSAVSIANSFAAAAAKGTLSDADAQNQAKAVLRSIRFGKNDYMFVYTRDGRNIVNGARPDFEGKILSDLKDANGVFYIRKMLTAAFRGGGFVKYLFPRMGEDKPVSKLSYAASVQGWDWMVGTGVYVDDLDATFFAAARSAAIWATVLIAALSVCAMFLARGLVRPVNAITVAMGELAAGNLAVDIPGIGRKDEVGAIADAVAVFKTSAVERQLLEHKQKEAEEQAAAQRKAELRLFADRFEATVGGIIGTVSSAAAKLESSATSLTQGSVLAEKQSAAVACASSEASNNVQAVAAATNEMTAAIEEITRQVQASSVVADQAVRQAQNTDARVGELSEAASRIGDVVRLITAIAEQTNLLALNATIEAARAGEVGKGFAVVAQEVKALAAQTSKATGEISLQIQSMQTSTQESVIAIKDIGQTIIRVAEIASAITASVEQQSAATAEISRNIQQAAVGTSRVAENVMEVRRGAEENGAASGEVLSAVSKLAHESNRLEAEVKTFLDAVRAA